jgi:hypothetical protein
MLFTDFAVDHPRSCLCVCYILLLVIALIMGFYDLAALSDENFRDYLVWHSDIIYNMDMRNLLKAHAEKYGGVGEIKPLQRQEELFWTTSLVYQNRLNEDYGLLLKDNLLKMA